MVDLLRVESNERIDLDDFQYLANGVLTDAIRDQGRGFLCNPDGAVKTWILGGFGMANPVGKQLTVARGRALLGYRVGGITNFGMLTIDGDTSKTVDMTALTPGTYNVYVRFEYIDTTSTGRVFWDPAGAGEEFTQTVPTRLQANWSIRVETSSPGTEWTRIGTADNSGGSLALVDMRKFYFEGAADATYQSGWSLDGGGGADDRNADRALFGAHDLQTFTAATRQCLEDIKGRGLRAWYSRDIGGMNVGFDAAPVEDRVAIGDANYAYWFNAGNPRETYDSTDYIEFNRTLSEWRYNIGSVERARLSSTGLALEKGLSVGFITSSMDDDTVAVGDSAFSLAGSATNPRIFFDTAGSNDYLEFSRTNNYWTWYIAGTIEARLSASGLAIQNGLYVGSAGVAPVDDEIYAEGQIRSATNLWATTGSIFTGANLNSSFFNSATGGSIYCNSAGVMQWTGAGLVSVYGGLNIGSFGAPTDNDLSVLGGATIGFAADAVDNTCAVRDANFRLDFATANKPSLHFEDTTYLEFDRSAPGSVGYRFMQGGVFVAAIRADTSYGGLAQCASFMPTSTTRNPPATGNATLLNQNTCPFMIVQVNFDGSLTTDAYWNVASVTHTGGTGVYDINYTNVRSSAAMCPSFGTSQESVRGVSAVAANISANYARAYTYNITTSPWTAADANFSAVVYTVAQ